jgi:hypothetical protein
VNKIKGKKIMMVAKETFSYPFYYLSEEWIKDNELAFLWVNPSETMLKKCLLNDTTYFAMKDKYPTMKQYTLNEPASMFDKQFKTPRIDWQYIYEIEKKYCNLLNFNRQIIASQFASRHYHWRDYFKYISYEQQILWIELIYKHLENILDEFKPDYIFDLDLAEFPRIALCEICIYRNIPYITREEARYDFYSIPSFDLGQTNNSYFIEEYQRCLNLEDSFLDCEIKYIKEFRDLSSIMAKELKANETSKYDALPIIGSLKRIYSFWNYFKEQNKKGGKELIGSQSPLYCNSNKFVKSIAKQEWLCRKYLRANKLFEKPVMGEKYVYLPLHYIPESSTFTKAPFYVNEIQIIEAVSKALPIGWYLYVKEHQIMLGERGGEFYNRVKRIPNVRLVQLNYYKDPKPWIEKSQGVVTISGTTAFEAALLGKKSLVFSNCSFDVINSVIRVKSIEELPELIREFANVGPNDNIHSVAAYIRAVKNLGVKFDIIKLGVEPLEVIRSEKNPSVELLNECAKVESFFKKAIDIVEKSKG